MHEKSHHAICTMPPKKRHSRSPCSPARPLAQPRPCRAGIRSPSQDNFLSKGPKRALSAFPPLYIPRKDNTDLTQQNAGTENTRAYANSTGRASLNTKARLNTIGPTAQRQRDFKTGRKT